MKKLWTNIVDISKFGLVVLTVIPFIIVISIVLAFEKNRDQLFESYE